MGIGVDLTLENWGLGENTGRSTKAMKSRQAKTDQSRMFVNCFSKVFGLSWAIFKSVGILKLTTMA